MAQDWFRSALSPTDRRQRQERHARFWGSVLDAHDRQAAERQEIEAARAATKAGSDTINDALRAGRGRGAAAFFARLNRRGQDGDHGE